MKLLEYARTLPLELKTHLLALANHVPVPRRQDFLRNTVARLERFSELYPRTVIWSVAGTVLGKLIQSITGVPAALPGLVIGAAIGFQRDLLSEDISRVIKEELQRHTAAAATTTDPAP